MAEGQDLPPGPPKGKSKEIGATGREKEASPEGNIGHSRMDRSKERQRDTEDTIPGSSRQDTRQGKGQEGDSRKDVPRRKRKR